MRINSIGIKITLIIIITFLISSIFITISSISMMNKIAKNYNSMVMEYILKEKIEYINYYYNKLIERNNDNIINEIIKYLKAYKYLKSGHFIVIDSDLKVVYHPTIPNGVSLNKTIFQKMLVNKAEGEFNYFYNNKYKTAKFKYLSNFNWYIILSLDVDDVVSSSRNLFLILSVIIILSIVLFIIVIKILLDLFIIKQLNIFSECFIKGISGDFKVEFPIEKSSDVLIKNGVSKEKAEEFYKENKVCFLKVGSFSKTSLKNTCFYFIENKFFDCKECPVYNKIVKDEIYSLGAYFNYFFSEVYDILNKISNNSMKLYDYVKKMIDSSRNIFKTSNQQSAAVKEMVTTMEEAVMTSKNISGKTNEVANIIKDNKNLINQGFDIIQRTYDKMSLVREKNNEEINGIKSLGEEIDSIWEIVNIINSIADQTKIIAFNAELEASSAGETGKNFEIVAAEIRRLAENTVQSTKEIKSKIAHIQESAKRLVSYAENETVEINEEWELFSNLKEIFKIILESSEKVSKSAENIAKSISQQDESYDMMLMTLKQISSGIEDFVNLTKDMNEISKNFETMADELDQIVKRLS